MIFPAKMTWIGKAGTGINVTGAVISLAGQALALHNLASNGLIARTAAGTVAARTLAGTANQITVTNGDGVSGNPTLSLPQNIHTGASPTFAGIDITGITDGYVPYVGTGALAASPIYTSGGNIGVGTTTATRRLEVVTPYTAVGYIPALGVFAASVGGTIGARYISANIRQGMKISAGAALTMHAQAYDIEFQTGTVPDEAVDTQTRMRISNAGDIGMSGRLTVGQLASLTQLANFVGAMNATYPQLLGQVQILSSNAFGVDKGGVLTFGGKYNTAGNNEPWASIYGLKENTTDGDYSAYLGFFTRRNGEVGAERARIDSLGNCGLGVATFGTSATKTLCVGTGTAPTTSPADSFQLYSADQTAGNACPHFRTENGAVVRLYRQNHLGILATTYTCTTIAEINTALGMIADKLVNIMGLLINNGLMAAA